MNLPVPAKHWDTVMDRIYSALPQLLISPVWIPLSFLNLLLCVYRPPPHTHYNTHVETPMLALEIAVRFGEGSFSP
jgi:hypothetical protein